MLQVNATSEVQVITVVAAASDLSGYFFVGYEGHWSDKVAYDASADDMASALAGIPAVGDVTVRQIQAEHALRFLVLHVANVVPDICYGRSAPNFSEGLRSRSSKPHPQNRF